MLGLDEKGLVSRQRFPSATRVLGANTTNCLRWAARLDYRLKLAPEICEIIRMGRLLRLLNHDLLVGLRYLLAYDLDVVISTTVIVPDFTASNRISDSEIEGLLRAERMSASLV